MTQPRTAFVFPGLNGVGHAAEFAPLMALPAFAARWQLVAQAFATRPGFAQFESALLRGDALPSTPETWPWRALAVTAMQLAAAEALESAGVRPDWLCSYSIGDVARCCFAGVAPFAAVVAFAAALPPLPIVAGATAAAHSPDAATADVLATRFATLDVRISRLSPRFLMIAGTAVAVAGALYRCDLPGVRSQVLANCALHAPMQGPVAAVLRTALGRTRLAAPRRATFSTVHGRPIVDVEDVHAELATNVTAPCHFDGVVEQLLRGHGVVRFVDLGPGRHASRFVRHHGAGVAALAAGELLRGDATERST